MQLIRNTVVWRPYSQPYSCTYRSAAVLDAPYGECSHRSIDNDSGTPLPHSPSNAYRLATRYTGRELTLAPYTLFVEQNTRGALGATFRVASRTLKVPTALTM